MSPREQLKLYRQLHEPKLSVVELAFLLGCSHQMVYALEAGTQDKVPGRSLANRIEQITGIPAASWDALSNPQNLKTA